MTKFRTKYQPIKVQSEPGSAFAPTYKLKYLTDKGPDGASELVIIGKVNVDEKIQSYRDSCDINILMQRFENGDATALNKTPSFYADLSDMPKNLAGYLQLMHDAQDAFYTLDPTIRAKFGNNPDQFFASIGTDKFRELLGVDLHAGSVNDKVEDIAEEVKE